MKNRLIVSIAVCSIILFGGGLVRAAEIVGRVLDANGRPVSGVPIRVENASGQSVGSTVSDLDGGYGLAGIPEGSYTLDVQGQSAVTYVGHGGVTVNWGMKGDGLLAVAQPGVAQGAPDVAHAAAEFAPTDSHMLAPLNLVSADRHDRGDHEDCDRDDRGDHRGSKDRCKCDNDRDDPQSCKKSPHR